MAIEHVEREIRRFLSTPEPEVICIKGRWGVGKTFAWNRYLKQARDQRTVSLKRYAYVSLFGLTSLDDLKFSVFESSVSSDNDGEPGLESLKNNTLHVAEKLGRKTTWFAQQLPWVKNHVGGLGPIWFLSVKNTIVCIDDFERRGDRLSVRDVLGLVSTLKEHRGCKIVLILNDEALQADKAEFDKFLEKVVDASLRFAPTPMESSAIALRSDTCTAAAIGKSCVALGISNIRVIKKIERAAAQIEPTLRGFDPLVLDQAVQALSLLGWSVLEPQLAPPLEYLENGRGADLFGAAKSDKIPQNEAAWNALLDAYRWQSMTDFDRALRDGIQNGFFDLQAIKEQGEKAHEAVTAAKAHSSWENAWRLFHQSFEDNEDLVLDAIIKAFAETLAYRTPLDLNSTVSLLKATERHEEAEQLIEDYLAQSDSRRPVDLSTYPFRDHIDEPTVIEAFKKTRDGLADKPDSRAILLSMAQTHSWNDRDIAVLSALSIDEYSALFTSTSGEWLQHLLNAALQFDRILNATVPMKEISRRAKEALAHIGGKSRLNGFRVRRFGIAAQTIEVP